MRNFENLEILDLSLFLGTADSDFAAAAAAVVMACY